jgi:pimeloyl-ACP methyl ester carboxylesterase
MTTTSEEPMTETGYTGASTERVTAANGIEYAYRDLGKSEVPLVLLQHFRGNLDNWDPALVDKLAAERRVIAFDNVGVGGTTGTTPNTVEAMAHDAIAFLEALELRQVDLLGFSIGSFVAQEIALVRPDLLRRVVLASSAPQGAAGMHGWAPEVIGAVGAPETTPRGYISVFFAPTETSLRRARGGRTHLRFKERPGRTDDVADPPGAVRRRLRLGHPEPFAARASRRDRPAGVRRQRRQRPDDPSALLISAGGAAPERAGHDLPGLGPRLPLPAPRRVRRRRSRLPSNIRIDAAPRIGPSNSL